MVGEGLRDQDGVGPRADGGEVLLREAFFSALIEPGGVAKGQGADEPGVDEDGGACWGKRERDESGE